MQSEVISNAKKMICDFLDEKSFIEFDELLDLGVIIGYGTVNGRPVCVFSQDVSVMSGAVTSNGCEKISKIIDMAVTNGVPLISFYDSIGAKITERTRTFVGMDKVFSKLANASGVIPIIGVVSGIVTGVATFLINFSDFVFMIKDKSKLFINSPQVLMSETGCQMSADEIGGALVHATKTGVCSFLCNDEKDLMMRLSELLDVLPDNNLADVEVVETDDCNRVCEELLKEDILAYDVISSISDNGKFLEVQENFAKNIIIGFSRVGGRVSGIVSNNKEYNDGKFNSNAIEKASKFVKFCDAFHIPLISLIDNDGFVTECDEELTGLINKSGKLLYAYSDATVPKISVIFGKAYGAANLMMGTGTDMVMAWDSAKISVAVPKSAVNVLFADEIKEAECPVSFREEKLNEYLENDALPTKAQEDGFVDMVITPIETRQRIISALDMFSSKREIKSIRRHGAL